MAGRSERFLLDLLQKSGNNVCADCGAKDPTWASYNLGVFLCSNCAGLHRNLGNHISKTKSLKMSNWEEDELKMMAALGNKAAHGKYEQQVPMCYRRPIPTDPQVVREQWIRAKYERMEFSDPDKQTYLGGMREGYLYKRGKDEKNYKRRRFHLSETEGTVKYYVKENKSEPKAVLRIDEMNAALVPEKIGNPFGMQLTFKHDGHTRNIFVYAEDGKDLIDWYTAIRSAKLNRLRIAYPGARDSELVELLPRDFVNEGWLSKTGPRPGDAYRRRWITLDKRTMMYYEDPLDAFPKGEIFIGTKERGFAVREGVPPGMKDPGNCFTLKTPERHFHFAADSEEDMNGWITVLKRIIDSPMSPQESSNMMNPVKKMKRSSLRS